MKADNKKTETLFSQRIGQQETRKRKAMRASKHSAWYGLGMFGMIGWSVAVPALLGTALGIWLDNHYPQSFSWTLTFLFAGLLAGCLSAWAWVTNEENDIRQTENETDE